MQESPGTRQHRGDTLLVEVARRQRTGSWARRAATLLTALTITAAVALAAARLLSFDPSGALYWLPVCAALAALTAWWMTPRVGTRDAARLIDHQQQSSDLFLTYAGLANGPEHPDYRALVDADTDRRAQTVQAAAVVPWRPRRGAARATTGMLAFAAVALWLPPLDRAATEADQERRDNSATEAQREAAAARRQALRKRPLDRALSPEVDAELAALRAALRAMKPRDPENQRRLRQQRQTIGDRWQERRANQQQRAGGSGRQSIGRSPSNEQRALAEAVRRGDSSSAKRKLAEVRELAQKASRGDRSAAAEARTALQELRETASGELGASELAQALTRALQELESSEEGSSDEALEDAALELEAFAQGMRDLAELEQALDALRLAEQLQQLGALDGEVCAECQSMGEAAECLSESLAQCQAEHVCGECSGQGCGSCNGTGTQPGPGSGGRGFGGGGVAEAEGPTGFRPWRVPSARVAGRMLLQWKTERAADSGEAREDYAELLRAVQSGASEAILREDVPPGYHDSIQGYFNRLQAGEKNGGK